MNSNIIFYLDKPKAPVSSIFLRYYCKDGDFRYSTKQKINPAEWNDKLQTTPSRAINSELDKIYTIVDKYLAYCLKMGKLDIYTHDIKEELNKELNRKDKSRKCFFFATLEQIIEDAKSGKLLSKHRTKYAHGTIKNFIKAKERLEEFNDHLDFSTITIKTYYDFINFCNERDYTANYTGSLIKEWKTLMGIAFSKGYHTNMIFNHPEFRIIEEDSYQVYLDDNDIQKLYNVVLEDKLQDEVRDRFIINLFTGLRISDMLTLTLDNFHNNVITHINKKTNKKVVIPVHPIIREIIKKYNGKLPKQYHEKTVNEEIKKIALKAKIRDKVYFTKTLGGEVKHFEKFKWELITNHTSRRSMATNMLKHMDLTSVMPVMGMTMKTLQHYNKRSAEENAEMLQDNNFFKKSYMPQD